MYPPTPPPPQSPGTGTPPDGTLVPYAGYPPSDLGPPTSGYPPSALRPPPSGHRRYLAFLGRKWWIPLLSVLFFGGLAAAYIAWWPASYSATAHMWAAGRLGLQLREGTTYAEDNMNFAGTQIELLQSDLIFGRAFNRVQQTLHISFPTNSEGKPILPSIKVTQLSKSAVLALKAIGPTETCVLPFLNAIMDEFLAYKKAVRSATSGDTYTSVSDQTVKQEAELKAEQDKLTAYIRDNNVAVLEEQAKAASAYLTQLLAEFSQLKLQYQLLEANSAEGPWAVAAMTNTLAGAPDPRQLVNSSLPSASPPPEFLGAQQEMEKIRILRLRLSKHLRPEHPKIVKLDEQIAQSEKLVEYLSRQSHEQLANAKQTVKMKLDRVQETIKEWEAKVNNASERIAEYERLKLNVGRLQELHDHLLSLLQTVDVSRNLDQENITILDRPSEAKDAKRVILVTAFLLFVGLGAGFGLVFLAEQTDDRVMSLEELASRFEEWIVGQVPEVPRARKKKNTALLGVNDDRHIFAESFRNIRSALYYGAGISEVKTLLVTSSVPNEGKSTISANLARVLAFTGANVLLIDCDLRRGNLHEFFGLPAEPGLSELLRAQYSGFKSQPSKEGYRQKKQGGIETEDRGLRMEEEGRIKGEGEQQTEERKQKTDDGNQRAEQSMPAPQSLALTSESALAFDARIQSTEIPNLAFLARGQSDDNCAELLISPAFKAFLDRARCLFDYVVIDSIPVFAADDTTSLAPKVDGVLFVVRNSFTSAETARCALELLYERQAKILGLVFNRANTHSRSYRYYKYADYHQAAKKS